MRRRAEPFTERRGLRLVVLFVNGQQRFVDAASPFSSGRQWW
jgi:hypothetical protein